MPRKKTAIKKRTVQKPQKIKVETLKKQPKKLRDAEAQARSEREKYVAMWAGVTFFMAIIVFFWIVSFKNNVQAINQQTTGKGGADLEDIVNNLNNVIGEIKNGFQDLEKTAENGEFSSDGAVSQEEEIENLRRQLEEIEQRLELENMLLKINNSLNNSLDEGNQEYAKTKE